MRLRSELYLAASKEAVVLYNHDLPKKEFFNCEALTLDQLIKKCQDIKVEDDLICEIYFKEVVKSLVQKQGQFKHFKFSLDNLYNDSVELMYDFYIKSKLNNLKLDDFFAGDKLNDIKLIFEKYERLKKDLELYDKSDLILGINKAKKTKITKMLKEYDSIVIDWQFYEANISFIRSSKEQELFDIIDAKKTKRQRKQSSEYTQNITLNKVFDFSAESKEAVKIAKTLLLDTNIKPSDIAIVVSKIDDYKDSMRFALDEYDLNGYISTGVDFDKTGVYYELKNLNKIGDIKKFIKDSNDKLQTLEDNLKDQYAKTINLGLKISKKTQDTIQKLKTKNIKVKYEDIFDYISVKSKIELHSKKDAVLITEHNQLLKTKYKHIIYLGIDSTHLPQRFSDNFLYGEEHTKELHISNYYKDAVYIYDRLKRNTQNLHLIMASYQNKRELQPSSVITDYDEKILPRFIVSDDISTLNDLLDNNTQSPIDEETKQFIVSKQTKKEGRYNGVLDLSDDKPITFSASRLNEYSDCPLKYYFNSVLKSKSPQDHSDDEFNAAEAGTLFHAVVESFAKIYKRYDCKLLKSIDKVIDDIYVKKYTRSLPLKDGKPYETVYHKTKKIELQIAIDRFKVYVQNGELDNFYKAEEKFDFEMDGNQFTGFIDRIDIDEDKKVVSLIDYKTSKADSDDVKNDKKFEKLTKYKEFQLPLYHFFVEQDEKYKKYNNGESYLLTFTDKKKDQKFNHKRFGQVDSSLKETDTDNRVFAFNDEAKVKYKEVIKDIANSINKGAFYHTASKDSCQWCQYISVCGDGVKTEKKF